MKKLKNILIILILFFTNYNIAQSIEITSLSESPLEVNPLLGSDLTINFKYTSHPGATGHNIYISLEVLDSNNNFVKTVINKDLTQQQAGANIPKSTNLFIGSINPLTEDLPSGQYYQILIRLYDTNWNELAAVGHWNTPALILQDTSGFVFNTNSISKGADISWMTEMEDQGYTWKDNDGNTKELLPLLKEYDIDAVRLRVWVNPENSNANGWCDIDDMVVKAEKAQMNGQDILICIHYSDWWADPGHQTKPDAWTNYSLSQLETAVANHTTAILNALDAKDITPKWIQIGNETNDGMLWTTGKASTGGFANYAKFLNAGANAVKTFNSSIKTILHIAGGDNNSLFRWNIDGLINNGFQQNQFDIIGMSLYPDENNWKTYVDATYNNMIDLKSRYNKDVMMVEIGFSNSRPDITYQYITYMIEKTKQAEGLGVFYWEPIARSPFVNYSKGAWDADGSPSVAMDAFIDKSVLSADTVNLSTDALSIFPNPTRNLITVNSTETPINSLKLYNTNGNLLIDKKGNQHKLELDLSKLATGIYFLNINHNVLKKIIKQ